MPTVALYAGSFDPMTRGHLDVLSKARQTFDQVYVSIGVNPAKKRLFDLDMSMTLIQHSIDEYFEEQTWKPWRGQMTHGNEWHTSNGDETLFVSTYAGKTIIDYANEIGATHIVRGFRQAGDFNDEFTLAGVAGHLDRSIIFTHFICREEFLHISSSTARELAKYGANVDWLVTPSVAQALANMKDRLNR